MHNRKYQPNLGFEENLEEGVDLYAAGKNEEALHFFLEMRVDYPQSSGVLLYLGALYSELGKTDLSLKYASRAVCVCPYGERSSFTLHLVLKEAGLERRSYEEIERFFNTPGAQPTALYKDYLDELARAVHLDPVSYADYNQLIHALVEKHKGAGEQVGGWPFSLGQAHRKERVGRCSSSQCSAFGHRLPSRKAF